MTEPLSILFFCRNFHQMAGGLERMAIQLMNQMVKHEFRVGVITWDLEGAKPHYSLDTSVQWIQLNMGASEIKAGWFLRIKRQIALRKMVKQFKPDVAIGFMTGTFIAARVAMTGLGIPLIAAERVSPDLFDYVSAGNKKRCFAYAVLTIADCITVQMESYKKKYPKHLGNKIVVIPNPVTIPEQPAFPNEKHKVPQRILSVGRLSAHKNQIFLIKAFAQIAVNNPGWVLTLVGEGETRHEIESVISRYKLLQQIELIGAVTDVDQWYEMSSFFVFPSLYEGFPNALVEAFSHGLPAIGLEQTSGVNELLMHKKSGLLSAYDTTSFASAMQYMIDNLKFRQLAGRQAYNSVLCFKPESIFDHWEQLFTKLTNKSKL